MENDFSLTEWKILRFFVFIARNEKKNKNGCFQKKEIVKSLIFPPF